MAHSVTQGPYPNLMLMAITGEVTFEDMTCDDELRLNEGYPGYIMLDASKMSVGLPPDFLDGAKQSFFGSENLVHLAIYMESAVLRNVALMVAKLMRRKEKLTIHDTKAEAIAYLEHLITAQERA